jgi:predicted nuclease of predicted toxin-antitoxin system
VKFLVDAQLPARVAAFLAAAGHDAIHTSELPDGNRTTDRQIAERADTEGRVVVTKDSDFRDSHLLTGRPAKLLVVATGNITNNALLELLGRALDAVVEAFDHADFVELHRDDLVVHQRRSE